MQTFATRDGIKLAYYVDDFTDPGTQSETVLLLHAAMGNSRRWFKWVPRLSRRYRVVRSSFSSAIMRCPRPITKGWKV